MALASCAHLVRPRPGRGPGGRRGTRAQGGGGAVGQATEKVRLVELNRVLFSNCGSATAFVGFVCRFQQQSLFVLRVAETHV